MGHKTTTSSLDTTQHDEGAGDDQNGNAGATSAFSHLSFADVLEDLSSRFIVNLPAEELASIERICFQVEQAHWFYEDFLRPLNPSLTSLSLRRFSSYLLHTSSLTVPLIQRYISTSSSGKKNQQDLEAAFDEFMKYKTRVPVCGVVMLNKTWDKCVLVKGWKSSAAWGFPKGKINQQESERDCAVREVLEETGFDCDTLLESSSKDFMELTMREQKIRLYIVPGVDENTHFETLTRKEISKIAWFKLSDLPTWKKNRAPPQGMGGKFYLISPFIGKLKQWIHENKHRRVVSASSIPTEPSIKYNSVAKEEDDIRSDDLKALLGLGQIQSISPPASKGVQMIQEQGDARGRQLLDLLRGDSAAVIVEGKKDEPSVLDERERGTAALLAALNAGAGKTSEVPANSYQSNSATLLSMLNGSMSTPATNRHVTASKPLPRKSSPLPAPLPQNTSQAQSLLKLISPGEATTSASSADTKDQERARQRDALLNNLMASSTLQDIQPSFKQDQRRVDDFRFPHAPPPPPPFAATQRQDNLLSLLQPNLSQRDIQHHTLAPSPFSTFVQQQATQESIPHIIREQNPLLALLNGNDSAAPPPKPIQTVYPPPPPPPYPMHQPPPPPHFMNFAPPSPHFVPGYTGHQIAPPPAHLQHYMMAPPPSQHVYHAPPSDHYYTGPTTS